MGTSAWVGVALAAAAIPAPNDRLEAATRPLLGAPYATSPLGEGRGPDPDPRFRLDAFDCATFVETGLALAAAGGDRERAPSILDRIRYRGPPSFVTRRHLVTGAWLPELTQDGWLEVVRPPNARRIRFSLTPARWRRRRIARKLDLPEAAIPFGEYTLWVLPLASVRPSDLPTPAVLSLVRVNWPLSPELVTHQGLLLRIGAKVVLRHASTSARRVLDEPLDRAIARWAREERKWPIAGITVHRVRFPLSASDESARSRSRRKGPPATGASGTDGEAPF